MVVGVSEERVRIRRVHGEQGDDAPDQQVEGGRTLPLVDGESNRGGQEEDVAERIRDGDGLLEPG